MGAGMSELRVSAWKRFGQDRLYVNLPDGTAVAWLDRKTGHVQIKDETLRSVILEALAPFVNRQPTPRSEPGPVSPDDLSPEYDLARRRPGDALRGKVKEESPGILERTLAWMLRRPTAADSWRAGLRGERVVGRELVRLSRHGWFVLHSIPVTAEWDIDHLLMGPGGVFSVNTKNHSGKSVWVGDSVVRVNHGENHPYPRNSLREAALVKRVLDQGCGFPVAVNPLLVFVRPARLQVANPQGAVRAIDERGLAAFAHLNGVLDSRQKDMVYAVARDSRSWKLAP